MPGDVVVIVGASLAGGTAAATLRDEGFDGRIVLVGAEAELPYERPPLSKGYLKGETPREKLLVRPEAFWAEHEVELELGTPAARIDPRDARCRARRRPASLLRQAARRDRRAATAGCEFRAPSFPACSTCERSRTRCRIREAAGKGGRAVVVGMGFIGSEVAATLRQLGLDVVCIEPFAVPLERALGPEVGRAIAELHREHGVVARYGEGVDAFEGAGRSSAS